MQNWIAIGLFLLLYTFSQAQAPTKDSAGIATKKILLIGMDGCRADALVAAKTPVLDQLMAEGYHCLDARTVVPTMSGPGWASMLTGVWYNKHKVNGNLFIGSKLNDYVHLFNHIENQQADLHTVSISHWGPINEKIIRKVDHKSSPKSDEKVAKEAIQLLETQNPDAVFLHFDDIDHAGHFSGFSPKNKKYIKQIEKVDSLIGAVLQALRSRNTFDQEDWLIMLSPDHGGINLSHGGGTEVERTTFVIAHHKNILPQAPKPSIKEHLAEQIVHFGKPKHQMIIPALEAQQDGPWSFELTFRIKQWKADAYLVNAPNLIIKTHPKDQHTWLALIGNKKIKIQGDSIHNQDWHRVAISCSKDGLISVYQNGRIVGINQLNSPIKSIIKDSILLHHSPTKEASSLVWDMEDCRLWACTFQNPNKLKWLWGSLEAAPQKDLPLVFSWQGLHHNKAKLNAPIISKKTTVLLKDYSHYPTMVDICPSLLEHLGIDISKEQKATYFDGWPLIFEEKK